ncbi:MAG: NAD-dependent epimerase/dehydratase family protein [Opitutales bacterium]
MTKDGPDAASVSTDWIQIFAGAHCLVTGGAGKIGRALVERLLKAGARVTVIDPAPRPAQWEDCEECLCYHTRPLSEVGAHQLHWQSGAAGPAYVFHLAATFQRTTEAADYLYENFQNNVEASHQLLAKLGDMSALRAYVFASSYLCYDEARYLSPEAPATPVLLDEDAPVRPRNLTGAAKLMHEVELDHLRAHRGDARWISARITRVYGPGSEDVLGRWIRAAFRNQPICVYGAESFFDYIYADDVAEGLLRLGAHAAANGVYNLGSGRSRRVSEALEVFKTHLPHLKAEIEDPPPDFRFEASQVDMAKTFSLLPDFTPRPIEAGLAATIAAERSQLQADTRAILSTPNPQRDCRVLLTSAGAKKPMAEALERALRRLGLVPKIVAGDTDPHCRLGYQSWAIAQLPEDNAMTPETFLSVCERHKITHVVPSRDGELSFLAELAESKPPGIHFFVAGSQAVARIRDKLEFACQGSAAGYPVIPASEYIDKLDTKHFVVKERHGAGSRNIGINLTRTEALQRAESLADPLFQPFVAGREFSADSYVTPAGQFVGTVLRWRDDIVDGESHVTTSFRDAAIEALVQGLLATLGVTHHSVTQGIVDAEGQVHFIEVNARWGGASTLSESLGLRSFTWWLAETLGESAAPPVFEQEAAEARLVRFPSHHVYWLD